MNLADFLNTRYVRGGRGPTEFDCWGLTRSAKAELFGAPLLPSCADALPGMIPAITRSVEKVSDEFRLHVYAQPRPGMIATGWHGRVCVHVGLVVVADGRNWILETDEPTGPVLTRIAQFEERYSKVEYYAS